LAQEAILDGEAAGLFSAMGHRSSILSWCGPVCRSGNAIPMTIIALPINSCQNTPV
jgi:hypothetical protein